MPWQARLRDRGPLLVLGFVIVALTLLSTVPYMTFRTIEVLRRENDDVIEPARALAVQYELSVARNQSQAAELTLAQLVSLSQQLTPVMTRDIAALTRAHATGDLVAVNSASARVQHELRAIAQDNRGRLVEAQNRSIAWAVALFVITLSSMLAVGWLLWHQRLLIEQVRWARKQADLSAHDEQALRGAAAAVAAPLTTEEVVRQIARAALQASNADGAFAARLESDHIMHVIAVAGDTDLKLDTELPYADTIMAAIIETGTATVVDSASFNSPASQAVVVPLIEAHGPIGVLTLFYDKELDETTLPVLLARVSTFGDLAAIALRKARLLEQSEERRRKLESVEQSRTRLLRGFSHDIQNPLANANGFLQLLELGLRGPLAPQQLETLHRARSSLDTGLRMLRDLLDFAVASVGRISLTVTLAQIDKVVNEAVENHRAAADRKRILLQLENGQCPQLRTDIDRVRQVLDNLLSNAVKYTGDGGQVNVSIVVVETDGENPGHWVRIDVRDSGIGIPPEYQTKVFQEFTRLQPHMEPGAGIGLAISQSLATALGGRITVASQVGRGSTFSFWLPLIAKAGMVELIDQSERTPLGSSPLNPQN